ncbi:putative galacturonosyltransferase-like 7 [Capsicum annuum]|nr:putative galacturonosyltransferase-like 7 [Capsicum annuum]
MVLSKKLIFLLFVSVVCLLVVPASAIRSFLEKPRNANIDGSLRYVESPEYRNSQECPVTGSHYLICDPNLIHVAMTLDSQYFRGSIAAVHSVLKHTSCPENVYFHFVASINSDFQELTEMVKSIFPSLSFKVYFFDEFRVKKSISSSIRQALDNPLNYARTYLAEIIEPCVERVIYLDSDVVLVDDIQKLWSISLTGSRIIGAPEYCHANFRKYFSDNFWSDTKLSKVFQGKRPCYFNTGVMVMDLGKWRKGDYTLKIERWMEIHKEKRIYELGSLPPFMLVFGGEIEGIDHRWNQHGLGGDNLVNSCRTLHPGPVSLLHWSGKGKPWVRLDQGNPCPVDLLWEPYDLYRLSSSDSFDLQQQ